MLLERIARNEVISTSQELDAFLRQGNLETDSGLTISGDKDVMRISAAWAAVRIVANTVGQAPLHLRRRTDDGFSELVTDHRATALLRRPNPVQTNFRFRKVMQMQVLLHGFALALKSRRGNRQVTNLLPVHSSRVEVESADNDEFDLRFKVRMPGRDEPKEFRAADVVYLVGESIDGILGASPTKGLRNAFGLALAVEKHGARLFKNGAQFSGVLKHPKALSDDAYTRLKDSFKARNQGVDNAWDVFIAEEGMEWLKAGMTAEESQFLQTRKFQAIEIARIFGVPPHLLFELDRATFSNIEHQSLEFVKYFIQPHWENWEQELDHALLTNAEREEFFFEHDPTRLLRGDTKTVTDQEVRHVQWGIRTRNEIRRANNWPPKEGLDDPLTPANMEIEDDSEPEQTAAADDTDA